MPIVHDPKTGQFMRGAMPAGGSKLGTYGGHEIKMYRVSSEGRVFITAQKLKGSKATGPEKIYHGASLAEAKNNLRRGVKEGRRAEAVKAAAKTKPKPTETAKPAKPASFAAKPSKSIPPEAYVQGEHMGYKLRNFAPKSKTSYTLSAQKGSGKVITVNAENRKAAFEKISREIYRHEAN